MTIWSTKKGAWKYFFFLECGQSSLLLQDRSQPHNPQSWAKTSSHWAFVGCISFLATKKSKDLRRPDLRRDQWPLSGKPRQQRTLHETPHYICLACLGQVVFNPKSHYYHLQLVGHNSCVYMIHSKQPSIFKRNQEATFCFGEHFPQQSTRFAPVLRWLDTWLDQLDTH